MKTSYKEIHHCLKHLIETQDIIIIPDFGALIMSIESAEFSLSQNVLFPPRKKIIFNPLLTYNDGLLITELQKTLNIEYVLAQTMVNQFVQSLNILLDTNRRADIEGIGYFYKDIDGNVLFESELNPFYLSESLGLYPVQTLPVQHTANPQQDTHTAPSSKIIRLYPNNWYKAAIWLLIISLGILYWLATPNHSKFNMSHIFGKKPRHTIFTHRTVYPNIYAKYDEVELKLSSRVTKPNMASMPFMQPSSTPEVTPVNNVSTIYTIVVGCFKIQTNAQKLLNQLSKHKDIAPSIHWNAEKQMYIVSLGNYSSKEMAIEKLNHFKQLRIIQDGWIKKQ